MRSLTKLAVPLVLVLAAAVGAIAQDTDEEVPDVTARVARISFIRGDVQVLRSGSQDWEQATLNLPLVEGDGITTAGGARVEIQFDAYTHARVDERSYLKLATLKDEGIALSLTEGSMIVRASEFDKQRSYFEVDAPRTTVALEHSGMFRIDAGEKDATEIRVAATDGGEARVYTDSAGFTLKSGRSAQISIDGPNAGEWAAADASRYTNDFETWSLDRDATIAKHLRDAYYDKYYDRDIYGAEDLGDYGEWIHTNKYGYVWKPYSSAIGQYAGWSPYRYGHWRWVPPFGWTWVNDEPWGWATYHHGRWIWDDDHWIWTPYGYYRPHRSWWSPALVVIRAIGSSICWYPMPYNYTYVSINFNYHHRRDGRWDRDGHRDRDDRRDQRGGGVVPTVTPTPVTGRDTNTGIAGRQRLKGGTQSDVPVNGVVSVATNDFGNNRRAIGIAPNPLAREILAKNDTVGTPPVLPAGDDRARIRSDVRVDPPVAASVERKVRTGAMERRVGQPLDNELRRTRILGNRNPVVVGDKPVDPPTVKQDERRRTGAVDRPAGKLPPAADSPRVWVPPPRQEEEKKVDPPQSGAQPRVVMPRPRREPPAIELPARRDNDTPSPKRDVPRSDPPPRREPPPRSDPPVQRDVPRMEPPRREPAPKPVEQPKREEPKREEPKRDDRPAPRIVDRKKDDGR